MVQSGHHAELIAVDGPYRDLMAPQLGEHDDALIDAQPMVAGLRVVETTGDASALVRPLADEAAEVGWPETIRTLLHFVGPWKAQLGVIVLCGICRVLAFIGVGVFGALIIGAVRAHAPTLALVAALLVTAPLAGLLHWMKSWLAHAMAYQLLAEMRIDLFRKLDELAPAYLLRRRSGDLVALATQDVETVEYFFAHTVAPAIVAGLIPAGVLLALFFVCWPLAIVLSPFLVYAGASPVLGRRRIDTLGSEARGALGTLGAFATETIQGLAELAAFDATARRRKAFMAAVRRYQDTRIKLLEDLTWQTAGLEVATGLGGLAVAALGAPLVLHGWIPAWMLPLLVLVSISAFLPVSEIAQVGRQLADTIASTRRLHVVHAEPVVITDGPLEPAAPAGGSALRFDDVTFTYPGRFRPALSEVSFAVPPGSTVALVGPSGAGKTTIANLLLRFWDPDEGVIRLDGVDLRELTLDGLRGRVALVAQDTYLFNDTLGANVRLARPDATPDAGRPGLGPRRPGRLRGGSAGGPGNPRRRAWRSAIRWSAPARGDRPRLPERCPPAGLDEATSHLDTISEAQVRAALDALMEDRTTIVVAHRLSTIRAADLILVLQAGKVIEAGRHAELLARRGVYARLVEHQMAGVAEARVGAG